MPVYSFQQGLVSSPPKRDLNRCLMRVPIDEIDPNPNQPRRSFDKEALNELMVSIAQIGLIQPLTVREKGNRFELIAGERRLRACKLLGMKEVPCIILYADENRSALMALIENLQRKDLHFLEEALCFQSLLSKCGLTQDELANRIGKSQSFLSNRLRLLKLPLSVRNVIRQYELSERHARALLQLLGEQEQLCAARHFFEKKLNVQQAEAYVAALLDKDKKKPLRVLRLSRDYRLFINSIKVGVEQLKKSGSAVTIQEVRTEKGLEIRILLPDEKR
ncbi:MAG: ParB/RepB/Spo0J family partition protein [Clostridia bacterium]|nr:ParB/RepB/Spo0J family partition protein [Clostridia bacterium]